MCLAPSTLWLRVGSAAAASIQHFSCTYNTACALDNYRILPQKITTSVTPQEIQTQAVPSACGLAWAPGRCRAMRKLPKEAVSVQSHHASDIKDKFESNCWAYVRLALRSSSGAYFYDQAATFVKCSKLQNALGSMFLPARAVRLSHQLQSEHLSVSELRSS